MVSHSGFSFSLLMAPFPTDVLMFIIPDRSPFSDSYQKSEYFTVFLLKLFLFTILYFISCLSRIVFSYDIQLNTAPFIEKDHLHANTLHCYHCHKVIDCIHVSFLLDSSLFHWYIFCCLFLSYVCNTPSLLLQEICFLLYFIFGLLSEICYSQRLC